MTEVLRPEGGPTRPPTEGEATILRVVNLPGTHEERPTYTEMFRGPELSVGVYSIPAGSFDPQTPHTEDELYYIREGYGVLRVGSKVHQVGPGMMVHVPSHVPHRFTDIRQSIVALVIFAPPEGSRRGPA